MRSSESGREPGFPGTEKPLVTLRGHEGPIRAVTATRDARWLATVGTDRTLRIWDLAGALATSGRPVPPTPAATDDLDELMQLACMRAGRQLTNAEWREIFVEEPYRATCAALPPAP